MSLSSSQVTLHRPGTLEDFNFTLLFGTWFVMWTTFPMWRDKKSVTITYEPLGHNMFSSDVAHSKGGPPTHIRGVEKLTDTSGARFEWHGKMFLRLVHSKWEVLGMGEEDGLEWCVILERLNIHHLNKSIFTPAGCDLLARPKDGANPSEETRTKVLNIITAKLENIPGFAKMAESGFLVQ